MRKISHSNHFQTFFFAGSNLAGTASYIEVELIKTLPISQI